jgi:RimJ/RimL family protein N-acetyltransferase
MLKTERLIITKFTLDMAYDVHINSLDDDMRRFMADEIFETEEDAKETLEYLIEQYEGVDGPFVYPILLKETKANIGYVEVVKIDEGYEVGYHIAKKYTRCGYASEALTNIIPFMMDKLNIDKLYGICVKENLSSQKVLEKCKFLKFFEGKSLYKGEEKEVFKYIYTIK